MSSTPVRSGWEAPPPPPGALQEPTVGSMVSRTFQVYTRHFGPLMVLAALIVLPIMAVIAGGAFGVALLVPGRAEEGHAPSVAPAFAVLIPMILAFGAAMMVGFGGILSGVVRWLAGQPAGIGDMLKVGLRRLLPMLLTGLLVALATLAGYVLLVVPGIIVAIATSFAMPVAVVERPAGAGAAFGRSWELTKGYRWQLLGCFGVLFLVQLALNLATVAVQVASPVAGLVLNLALMLLSYPLYWILIAVAYHDVRVAKEGWDTSALTAVFE
jgi:hypothetical protein